MIIITIQVICNVYINLIITCYFYTILRIMEFYYTVCIFKVLIFGSVLRGFVYFYIAAAAVVCINIDIDVTCSFQRNVSIIANDKYLCRVYLFLRYCCLFDFFLLVFFRFRRSIDVIPFLLRKGKERNCRHQKH